MVARGNDIIVIDTQLKILSKVDINQNIKRLINQGSKIVQASSEYATSEFAQPLFGQLNKARGAILISGQQLLSLSLLQQQLCPLQPFPHDHFTSPSQPKRPKWSSPHTRIHLICQPSKTSRRLGVSAQNWLQFKYVQYNAVYEYGAMERRGKYSILTQPVYRHLTRKYDIHFNFFLTKPTNQILFNHTTAPSTLTFKDALIFADHNDYLKRYYFLKNAMDKDQIFDRIHLLAQFYGSAVLLRYEYPLMILTKTKSVFLKRLKRMKKILVQQGSSDESNSDHEQHAVSINSSQFLKSVSSSELQRKSLEDGNRLDLDFSLNEEMEVYDIFQQEESDQPIQNSLFLANIDRLTREVACEFVLEQQHNEEQVKHLVLDFDDFDREEVVRRYNKMVEKENRTENSSKKSWINKESKSPKHPQIMQPQRIKDLLQKKPMASSITITALDDHSPIYPISHLQNSEQFKKKSLMAPSTARVSDFTTKPPMKRSTYYQYELEHINFPIANEFVIAEDEMEDSPKNSSKYRHYRTKQNLGFMSSRQPNPRDRQSNPRDRQSNPRDRQPNLANLRDRQPNSRERYNLHQPPGESSQVPITKYSHILNSDDFKTKSKIYHNNKTEREQREQGSALQSKQDYEYGKQYYNFEGRYGSPPQPNNRMTSINININNLEEKKEQHRVNVKVNSKNKFGLGEEFEEEEKNYRAEKKKKIREKAAALLNRVKSQEHMRGPEEYDYQYAENNANPYFERYYN